MGREVPRRIRDRCVQLLSTGHTPLDVIESCKLEFGDDEAPSARWLQGLAKELGLGTGRGRRKGETRITDARREEARAALAKWGNVREAGKHMDPPCTGAMVSYILRTTDGSKK